MGHKVSIVTSDALDIPSLFKRNNNLTEPSTYDLELDVYRFPIARLPFFNLFKRGIRFSGNVLKKIELIDQEHFAWIDALNFLPISPKMYLALLQTKNFDIVNSTPYPFSHHLILQKIFERNKIPFIITPRMHVLDPLFHRPDLMKIAERADALIAITDYERDYFIQSGVDPGKIFVTGIGISPEHYNIPYSSFKRDHGIPEKNNIVLFIGRMEEYKGIDQIIKSMKMVWRTHPNTSLFIIGKTTSYTKEIKRRIQGEKRIQLIPDASDEIKIQALKSSNLLILPSRYESFGGVFLEAWVNGLPVIGAGIPAIESIIDDGVDGILLRTDEPIELAKKIIYLLDNDEVAIKMGANGKQKVSRNYLWKSIAEKTLQTYRYVKSNHGISVSK